MSEPPRSDADTLPRGQAGAGSTYQAGDVVAGKYRLASLLGEGGMGAVWLARNEMLDVDVAIKVIRSDVSSPETAQRLLHEARATARLKHPSIVRLHDFGETDRGDPYIVMERLDGQPLSELLETRGAMPATRAVQIMLPIVSALVDAHAEGIVHRDIKPDNVILVADRAGTVVPKVLDFGIAKLEQERMFKGEVSPDRQVMAERIKRRMTMVGTLVGSPDYMSPEQARADISVDERADIWSLCVVLYELVSGQRPFETEELEDTLIRILVDDPMPFASLGLDEAELWAICSRGMQKRRDERWPSARVLGQALADWLLTRGIDADIAGTALRSHWFRDAEPAPGRVSLASLHLEPAPSRPHVVPAATVTGAHPPVVVAAAATRNRQLAALVAVVAVTLGVVGLGAAMLLSTESSAEAPATATTRPPATTEANAVAASPQDDATDEEPPPAATTASATGSVSAAPTAEPAPPPRRPKPRPAPRPRRRKAPLIPVTPDF